MADVNFTTAVEPRLAERIPTLDNGLWKLLPDGRMETTFTIRPNARWHDGTLVSTEDLRFSWQVAISPDVPYRSRSAAQQIEDVIPIDAQSVTIRWKTIFSPGGRLTERDLFVLPRHLLEGKDRGAEMRDGYRFSGGPWLIDHWTKGQEIKLVPNPQYWGTKPNLDAVVFKVILDSSAYQAAYKSGQLDMIFVQGAQPQTAELRTLPDTHFEASVGLTFEFVEFNALKPPLDSKPVRQALAYATDRDAIVSQASGALVPGIKPTQAFMSPTNQFWYTDPFKRYTRDLTKVTQLMTGDGWAKGADGIWAKGGSRAVIELNTHIGNERREAVEQILQSQWKEAGFGTTVNNAPFAVLSGDWLAHGTFQAAIIGIAPPTPDPNRCGQFCSRNIPTEASRFQGNNVGRISSPALDETWGAVEQELDGAKRRELHRRAQDVLADEVPALLISAGVDVIAYNATKVGGPVKASPLGAFGALNEWYCKACH
jgi:peptide/nickel transport system substrate-binding protein